MEQIVDTSKAPDTASIELWRSTCRYLGGTLSLAIWANEVAEIRANIPEDYQDITAALAGWLDEANFVIDVLKKPVQCPRCNGRGEYLHDGEPSSPQIWLPCPDCLTGLMIDAAHKNERYKDAHL